MKKKYLILLILPLFVTISCVDHPDLPAVPPGVQTYSLLGDTLYTPEIHPDDFDELNRNLIEAVANYRADPGEYREAVRIFTEGIFKHADDPRMYRHRGHRYLTLRVFDRAIQDFENAAIFMRHIPDQVEPDGLPNPLNEPVSTLKSNVWYHLGLTHYVKGDFDKAIEAYQNAFELDLSEDMRIATLYWYYSALKRSGRDEEAGLAIKGITPDIELIENDVYLNLILVFNGIFDADRLMESGEDIISNVTLAYGLGNWHYMNGREERAFEIWNQIYDTGHWPAFGYIAAEAELARL